MKRFTTTAATMLLIIGGALIALPAQAQNEAKKGDSRETGNRPVQTPPGDNPEKVQDTTKKAYSTQSQGNSGGGTSAWPQATGTTGAITPESQTPATGQGTQQGAEPVARPDSKRPEATADTAAKSKKDGKPRRRNRNDPQ
ncbi:hypothetical protein GCM10010967_55150 [Dyadobacter beijingensis]|uniref:Uncharacterized protein n=1 Tax=Dyadobacter beijingensis TaxID=365489 RepID=A0ABQ2IN33_9BACT|nr:hypothetical protein [Dyadobacter beijingensis]GGN12132.1 hypothetical protein GCM10010967_55150 [Dyadobacter beijingensis]